MRLRFLHLVWLLLTSISLCTPAMADEVRPTLLVLGDSLSAGFGLDLNDTWPNLLQVRLSEEGYGYRVVNASISGDTTGNGLRRLPRALKIHQPEIMLIELGGNDGLRGIPVDLMKSNLEQMIVQTQETGALVILAGILIPPNYGEDYTARFSAVYADLAAKYATPLIPFFMEGIALDSDLMMPDGLHPNKQAQPILVENVWATLEPVLQTETSIENGPEGPVTN
jgi:acyl-CoA thioesterase-1